MNIAEEISLLKQRCIESQGDLETLIGQHPVSGKPIIVQDLFDLLEEQQEQIGKPTPIWYGKLYKKLQAIKLGDLDLDEYMEKVKGKSDISG